MSFEIGDRVEFKGGTLDHPGEKAKVVHIEPYLDFKSLLLVKMDNDNLGWRGNSAYNVPRSLHGVSGLWWVHPRELSLIEPKDKTWPGYDID